MSEITFFDDEWQETVELRPFPLNAAYLISSNGRVRRWNNDGWLSPCVTKRGGYLAVSLWERSAGKGKLWTLNKLVAHTFCGPRPTPKHHAAHNNGDKTNNRRENIAWKTKAENEADKIAHGTTNRGERNGMAKLTDAEAIEIRRRGIVGERGIQTALAEEFGVTQGAISNIVNGKRRLNGSSI